MTLKTAILKMQKLLTRRFPRRSSAAWLFIGVFIFVYDVIAMAINDLVNSNEKKETFSDGCWRCIEHPILRWPIWLSILILVKHLAAPNFLRKYDPIGLVGKVMNYIKKRTIYA